MINHVQLGSGKEFDLIRELLDEWGPTAQGIGDDAAILTPTAGLELLASTDAFVEGVHFRDGWLAAREIGWRAAAGALSDLAAMGASPRGLLVSFGLPGRWLSDVREIARGIGEAAASVNCPIIGGNVSASGELMIGTTVLGECLAPMRRASAAPGDIIFVTGRLGGPAAAVQAMYRGIEPLRGHRMRFATPQPRIREAVWLRERGAHCAIDISDGLAADAGHIAAASGVTLSLESDRIPLVEQVVSSDALYSGEEYELLLTIPARAAENVAAFQDVFDVDLTRIGTVITRGTASVLIDGVAALAAGHDHLHPKS